MLTACTQRFSLHHVYFSSLQLRIRPPLSGDYGCRAKQGKPSQASSTAAVETQALDKESAGGHTSGGAESPVGDGGFPEAGLTRGEERAILGHSSPELLWISLLREKHPLLTDFH